MKIENTLAMPVPSASDLEQHSDLEFSIATKDDFEEIMSISKDIYGGLDYLPSRFQSWLKDQNRTIILARKEGKVIALESVCIIDEGETVLVEGLRVAPGERGKGVARVLLKFCSQYIKSKYPEVKVTRLTRDDKLGPRDFQKYRLITKQGILLMRFCAEDLKQRLQQILSGLIEMDAKLNSPPVLLDPNEVHRIFLNKTVINEVLANKTIVQDWQPFKPIHSNLEILLKKDIDWMVDSMKHTSVASLCTFPFHIPIGEDWYYLNIDIFGKDVSLVRSQFLAHLKRHIENLHGHVMCQVCMDPALWETMADFCKRLLEVELVKGYTEQCVVEADIV
ncbi:histidine N-acetyltransferase-like [Polypterus senegalus]|nr:histidine N-acetyltransferase-like [Polypterus senegalus]